MLEAAGVQEELMVNEVVAAEGTKDFVLAIKEFGEGALNVKLLEVLCCNGCIMGAGMSTTSAQFSRREAVSKYSRQRYKELDEKEWQNEVDDFAYLDLSVDFKSTDLRLPAPSRDELKHILERMGKFTPEDELNCGACGYETCVEHAIAIHKGLAESEMCLPYTIEKLKATAKELSVSYEQLANTQQALIQSEKLASMGQLAAGIAHEVNNPLGVVVLYGHLLLDQCPSDSEMYNDLTMIVEQADRCKKIVGGLLNFARKNKVVLQPTDIVKLIDRSLKTIILPGNIKINTSHVGDELVAEIDSDQIIQVLTNLIANAVEAMPTGGTLTISTEDAGAYAVIKISDTGIGIRKENKDKVFEPFFTTKQIGKGTGLGLAVIYGIIKMHRGNITVESNNNPNEGPTGTTFIVSLPKIGLAITDAADEKESLLEDIK